MSKTKKCLECGAQMKAEVRDHQFVESGLENVWIEGVTALVCPNGHERLAIPALGQVHRVLAQAIVSKGNRLKGPEVKYLRKHLGLSNQDFARVMGVSVSQASRWASGSDEMGQSAEYLLRVLVHSGIKPESYPLDEVGYLKAVAELRENAEPEGKSRIALKRRSNEWRAEETSLERAGSI